jgi:hypothetical protein
MEENLCIFVWDVSILGLFFRNKLNKDIWDRQRVTILESVSIDEATLVKSLNTEDFLRPLIVMQWCVLTVLVLVDCGLELWIWGVVLPLTELYLFLNLCLLI